MYAVQNSEAVIQNLKDAGCDAGTIEIFMDAIKNGKIESGLKLLSAHRRILLDGLHKEQKKIDCLDYLIYTIKKQVCEVR